MPIEIKTMIEIQSDWPLLDRFYVKVSGKQYFMTRSATGLSCSDPSVAVEGLIGRSFRLILSDQPPCCFFAPKSSLDIHHGSSINCIDITPDGLEILTGDCYGRLFLTHLGTEPVPLPGPSEGFEIEDCLVDDSHHLFFGCGGDFRIYEYSAVEYQFTGRYDGHRSSVSRIRVNGDRLFSGARDGSLCTWDIKTRKRIGTSSVHTPINDFCFTGTSSVFAAGDSGIFGIDASTGQPSVSPGFTASPNSRINSIASCGDFLTIGMENGAVVQWDLRKLEEPICEWKWYDAPVNRVRYEDARLWVLTNDGTAACIDVAAKHALAVLGTKAYVPVRGIAFRQVSAWTCDGEGILSLFEF
jgi:WD40 repeat protein